MSDLQKEFLFDVVFPAFEFVVGAVVDLGKNIEGDFDKLRVGHDRELEEIAAMFGEAFGEFEELVVVTLEAGELGGAMVAVEAGLGREHGLFVVEQVEEGFERGFESGVAFGLAFEQAGHVFVGKAAALDADVAFADGVESGLDGLWDGGGAVFGDQRRAVKNVGRRARSDAPYPVAFVAEGVDEEPEHVALFEFSFGSFEVEDGGFEAEADGAGAGEVERDEAERAGGDAVAREVDEHVVLEVVEKIELADVEADACGKDFASMRGSGIAAAARDGQFKFGGGVAVEVGLGPTGGNFDRINKMNRIGSPIGIAGEGFVVFGGAGGGVCAFAGLPDAD